MTIVRVVTLLAAACLPALLQAAERPDDLYIVAEFRSDASPFWSSYLMELRPTDSSDWELRWWRIAPTSSVCAGRIDVKLATRRVSEKAVRKVWAGVNPCGVRERTVERVYAKEQRVDLLEHPADYAVVANCSGERRMLDLPALHWKTERKLERRGSAVTRLRSLYWDLGEAAGYGDGSPFADLDDEEDLALQQQAESTIPELRSGRYDAGGSWARILERYDRPRHPDELQPHPVLAPEFSSDGVELDTTGLSYPPLAKQARIQGRVSIRYEVEPETGRLLPAEDGHTGHPLLLHMTLKSIDSWRAMNPEDVGSGPFTVGLDFDLGRLPAACIAKRSRGEDR